MRREKYTNMELGDLIRIWVVIIVVGVCVLIVRKVTPKDSTEDFSSIEDPSATSISDIFESGQPPSVVKKNLTAEQMDFMDLARDVKRIKNLLEWFWFLSVLGVLWGLLWLLG